MDSGTCITAEIAWVGDELKAELKAWERLDDGTWWNTNDSVHIELSQRGLRLLVCRGLSCLLERSEWI